MYFDNFLQPQTKSNFQQQTNMKTQQKDQKIKTIEKMNVKMT
jgi:hypothetical protein